ncbi:RNA binding protein [Gordonia phage RedWattleHog]|uniref:RNA binding protein n=1 Tax=Gordonia phage Stormageddon TaxID=2656541 RepID=A0A649VRQ2_9CAUD|nr:RNA binding protein [Gordonia phage Stormageddon]QGJ94931.1 RNA binding protein [Gordonia phage Stormageddon]QLF83575.1 RNA binding protein [Gordonia phage RedWattleHog]
MTDERDERINLGLEGNQVLQKYLAKKSVEMAELRFECNVASYTGFVTGLDQEWVKLTSTDSEDNLNPILLRLDSVNSVSETGRRMYDMGRQDAEQIKAFTGLFRKASNGELSRVKLA